MKQFIVLISMIALGLVIAGFVAGPDNSIKSALGEVWQHELVTQQQYP